MPTRPNAKTGRPPAPLACLLLVATILGCTWALVIPPFQAPDENAHVAYAQSLAERGELPGDPGWASMSTEQAQGADAANSDQTAQQPTVKPEWSVRQHERWLQRDERLTSSQRSDGGGPNPA